MNIEIGKKIRFLIPFRGEKTNERNGTPINKTNKIQLTKRKRKNEVKVAYILKCVLRFRNNTTIKIYVLHKKKLPTIYAFAIYALPFYKTTKLTLAFCSFYLRRQMIPSH